MMIRVVKNEVITIMKRKVFLIQLLFITGLCFLAAIAYKDMETIATEGLPGIASYSEEYIYLLSKMNGIRFANLFLTDFIYKAYFSFYLLFAAITAVMVFAMDREEGTMKFTLLTGVTRRELINGKVIAMLICSCAVIFFSLLISIVVGVVHFGGSVFFNEVIELSVIALLALFPVMALVMIAALLSQIRISYKVTMLICIGVVIVLGFRDTIYSSKTLSPIGAISYFGENIPMLDSGLLSCCLSSLIYFFVILVIVNYLYCKQDIFD